jgi:hypothetical protein
MSDNLAALKERHLASEHRAFQNARALAAQVEKAAQREAADAAARSHAVAQAKDEQADEISSLRKINDELRRQVFFSPPFVAACCPPFALFVTLACLRTLVCLLSFCLSAPTNRPR